MPGRPPLQIEAAAVAVHVQHLAAGVQPRNDAAFQRFRVKFLRPQAARRDLCLVKAAGAAVIGSAKCFAWRAIRSRSLSVRSAAGWLVNPAALQSICPSRVWQEPTSRVEASWVPMVSAAGAAASPAPPASPVREEVQGADQSLAAGGDRAGYIEDGRTADARTR